MKTKTKKILLTVCAMFLSVFMFAGCNLVEINKYKYYSQKVATVSVKDGYGEEYDAYKKTYTKKDLLNAYYNYAYSYVSQGQIDAETGINYAMSNMINSDILYTYIKTNYFDNPNYNVEFTDADKNDAKLEAFDSMQDSIYELEEEIFEEWGMEYLSEDELSEEEVESLRASYDEYSSQLEYIEEYDKIVLKDSADRVHDKRVAPEHFTQVVRDEEVSKEAYTRYIKQLQDNAKAEGVSTDETTVLHNEETRLIDLYTRSKYLEIFEDWYNKYYNFTYDTAINKYVLNDDILESVIQTFEQDYNTQKDEYEDDMDAYHEAMAGDDISGMYYHHSGEYVYVSHILLKFSDAQTAKIDELDKKLEKGLISESRYNELVKDIANRTVVTYEMNGETYTSNAVNVYNKIASYVNRGADATEKAKLFNDMIYIYNDDEGIMNSDFAYVVNIDENVEDKMVKPFANKAREMYHNGSVGDISDMVITDYGVHIIFYAGEVKSVVNDINTLTASDLFNTKTQLSSNKSLFDVLYDDISNSAYNTSANNFIVEVRKALDIEYFKSAYKDLYK